MLFVYFLKRQHSAYPEYTKMGERLKRSLASKRRLFYDDSDDSYDPVDDSDEDPTFTLSDTTKEGNKVSRVSIMLTVA